MKKIILCSNIHSQRDAKHLIQNIEYIRTLFGSDVPVYVSSNGLDTIGGLQKNVTFRKFATSESYQLGPTNSVLNCLRMLAEEFVGDLSEYNIIYVHPDLYAYNIPKILSLLDDLEEYDFVCRNYVGPDWRGPEFRALWQGINYYMTEDFLVAGRVIDRFKTIPYDSIKSTDELPFNVHEMKFASVIDHDLGLKVKKIDIMRNGDHEDNEMGFWHEHTH